MEFIILIYHRVLPRAEVEAIEPGLARRFVTPAEEFAAQMAYLKRRGICPLTFAGLRAVLGNGAAKPQRALLITFDDGREDHFRVVRPILEEHGLRATFFLITGLMGQPGYLTWEQAAELQAAGMEIGSHTHTHPRLEGLEAAEAEREFTLSQAAITERLGASALAMSLPHGRGARWLGGRVQAPYEFVCTSRLGVNTEATPLHALRRLPLRHGDSMSRFAAFAEADRAAIRRSQMGQALIDLGKATLSPGVYSHLRRLWLRGGGAG